MKKIAGLSIIIMLAAGTGLADVIFSEGFNSDFSSPYSAAFGSEFGITAPGIVTNESIAGMEGDGFAGLNINKPTGDPSITGGMDVSLGTVSAAGVTYTFSGDFGWQYGTLDAASDNLLSYNQTGFVVGNTTHPKGDYQPFNFGTSTPGSGVFTNYTFSYTTDAADVGQSILVRIRLQDNGQDGTLTQLLTDNWQVTAVPEPATMGLFTVTVGLILIYRFRGM